MLLFSLYFIHGADLFLSFSYYMLHALIGLVDEKSRRMLLLFFW